MSQLLFVQDVIEGGELEKRGVASGDVIISVNGEEVRDNSDFSRALSQSSEKNIMVYKPEIDRAVQYEINEGKLGITTIEQEAHAEFELQLAKQHNALIQRLSLLPMFTTDCYPGADIREALGVVRGSTVRSKHVGRDIMAGVKSVVGGEIKGYTELMAEAREEALYRMSEDAKLIGATAVIGVRFSTANISADVAEVTAYGTAVKV